MDTKCCLLLLWFEVGFIFVFLTAKIVEADDTKKLSEKFDSLIENLGYKSLNHEFDRLSGTATHVNSSDLIEKLTRAVEIKFNTTRQALFKLRDATERYHHGTFARGLNSIVESQEFVGCCDVDQTVDMLNERTQDVHYEGCHLSNYGGWTAQSKASNFSKEVFEVMKENLETIKDLKWQYFATMNGSVYLYPAGKLDSCITFDPRKRSWYAQSSTLHAKDVVIAIDVSGSMEMTTLQGQTLLDIVKIGANMVVNTLNVNDRVGVVAFSDQVVLPTDFACYQVELAVATPQNKQCIQKFINTLQGGALTNYVAGIKRAFRYFKTPELKKGEHRDRILLFLSDGMPTVGGDWDNISSVIDKNCAEDDITLLTYGIGKALQDEQNRELLTKMAARCPGEKKNHDFLTEITSPSDMQNSIANYYVDLHKYKNREEPVFTLPYLDAGGLGLVMSMCLSVQTGGKFVGVVCTDIQISDLLDDVINFHQGEISYAFLINQAGQTYFHPLLPTPSSMNENIGLIDIEALERDAAVREVLESMKQGFSGRKELETQRIFSRGSTHRDGVDVLWAKTTYLWNPIAGSNFSVCIVIASDEETTTFPDRAAPRFVYHDFRKQESFKRESFRNEICKQRKKLIQRKRGAVYFAQSLYKNFPKSQNETEDDVADIVNFMRNLTNSSSIIAESIRGEVSFTEETENFWQSSKFNPFTCKYIATVNGVFRLFPAARVNRQYDARKRSWFQRSVNNKGTTVVSSPYLAAGGTGYVVSMTKAICKNGCLRYSTKTPVAAVVGGDVSIYLLHDYLIESTPVCKNKNRCILIDSSGYIVLHDDFVFPKSNTAPLIKFVHISVKEPNITRTLLKDGILRVRACIDVLTIKNKYNWQIRSTGEYHYHDFNFYSIDGTNVFLIIKEVEVDEVSPSLQSCNEVVNFIGQSIGNKNFIVCDKVARGSELFNCSCSSPANFDPCPNSFDYRQLSDLWPTCVPESQYVDVFSVEDDDINSYPSCETNCDQYSNSSECFKTNGCMWCSVDKTGELLDAPFCSESSNCFFGIIGHLGPYGSMSTYKDSSQIKDENFVIILSATATVLSFVVSMIAGIVIYKRKKNARKSREDKSHLLGCTLRTSIIEMEKDNPSMVWANINDCASSTSGSKERISLKEMKQTRYSSSSDSIAYLAQKVEALVHRLDSTHTSPVCFNNDAFEGHGCCSSMQSRCPNVHGPSSAPSEYSTLPRSTSFTSGLSSRSSTMDSCRCSNAARMSAMLSHSTSHLAPFPEEEMILNPKMLLTTAAANRILKVPSERSCGTCCRRQPSERTWPGNPCNSSANDVRSPQCCVPPSSFVQNRIQREPSERSYIPEDSTNWKDVGNAASSNCAANRSASLPNYNRRPSADPSFVHPRNVVRRRRRNSHRQSNRSSSSSQVSVAAAATISRLIQKSLEAIAAEELARHERENLAGDGTIEETECVNVIEENEQIHLDEPNEIQPQVGLN